MEAISRAPAEWIQIGLIVLFAALILAWAI